MTQHSAPTLPNELIQSIVAELDPNSPTDRQALATLLRCSSAFWDLVAPVLYRSLAFDGDEVSFLIDGPHKPWETPAQLPLSDRKRRSLTFVRRMVIGGDIEPWILERLAAVSLPHTPLFPNVDKLHLGEPINYMAVWDHMPNPSHPPPKDFVLFNNPDLCAWEGGAHEKLGWLPMKGMRSFSFHGPQAKQFLFYSLRWDKHDDIAETYLEWVPPDWTTFRIYDDSGAGFMVRDSDALVRLEQTIRASHTGLSPIECYAYYEKEVCPWVHEYLENHAKFAAKSTPNSMIKVSTYSEEDVNSTTLPPVCDVCGELN
ncbi:hypothetical protein Q8F55_004760 [Vanrija albida]|uniref:F-box domain-containing protein n=1 Tax=Vanrija albida TaxID=181172 RepID=A0ABR3PZQ7_9TREE